MLNSNQSTLKPYKKNKLDIDHNNYSEKEDFATRGLVKAALFDNRIWLNTDEAAEYLRISVNALRIKVWRKQIVVHKFGNRLRFKKNDLDRCMRLYK